MIFWLAFFVISRLFVADNPVKARTGFARKSAGPVKDRLALNESLRRPRRCSIVVMLLAAFSDIS